MKLLRIPKLPKFRLPPPRKTPPPPKKLQARMRAADAPIGAYEDEEPQTKLTSAFIVVLILHVVAVGGIYAFNQIKASRRAAEPATAGSSTAQAAAAEPARKPAPAPAEPARAQQAAPVAPTHVSAPVAPVAPTLKQRVYNVKAGDNLQSIAKTFGVTTTDLKAANGLSSDMIHPGQVLNLPAAKSASETAAAPAKPAESQESKLSTKSYTVKSGDRLVFIAKRFNVTQEDLIVANKIKDPTKLQIGQTLKIPTKKGN